MLGYCTHPRFVQHETGPHHPERPERIVAVWKAIERAELLKHPRLKVLDASPADPKWLRLVHTEAHIQMVRHICEIGGGVLDQGDTPVCRQSYDIALLSLGAVLTCCDAVMTGQVRRAFAAVRPPGHHAEPDRPMGFCLFSNVAIAARYIQQQYKMQRIAIVDFDVHHGNGTQAAFDDDPRVMFISLHQNPRTCYPGSGHEWEIGTAAGRGYTVNIPFDPDSTDSDYMHVIDSRVVPELEEFHPEVLLISAGFDAHRDDPLASMALSDSGFEAITRAFAAVADHRCDGRLISALEGGYNLNALGRCVVRHMKALM